ncbi:MAG: chorismate synthase [Candidatus Heimdallarchaeota archaeon]|nr:chorismate synthase [Candidatus Heimdallarchaeota archaeon]MDH5645088.1 chorismate synthase [Candidatus Heimdallarchaeota archaeon]
MDTIGNIFKISLIGSSHGKLVGVMIQGLEAGIKIDVEQIQLDLLKRKPGQSKITTQRMEEEKLIIETGILNNHTTGDPILAFVRNEDVNSSYYAEIKNTPRPGHADYPASIKYQGYNDHRGGGRFSGRMTVGLVIAGSIANQLLQKYNIEIHAFTTEINGILAQSRLENLNDESIYSQTNTVRTLDFPVISKMEQRILELKKEGDSCGGIIECRIDNMPVGIGEPWFQSIESKISQMIFSIPSIKGIEFGSGFNSSIMKGSDHNDPYSIDQEGKIITKTNNAGGILGGLSNGNTIFFRVPVKPTSSISKTQYSINMTNNQVEPLKVTGRHDPCIVPRVVPVIKYATACVIYDLLMQANYLNRR